MRVEFTEINKPPLKMIGERCILHPFINQKQEKPYTKICYKPYIQNYNMK